MSLNRRKFFKTATAGTIGASFLLQGTALASNSANENHITIENKNKYAKLDKVLAEPILRKSLFSEPIIIKSLELLEYEGNYLCRVTDDQGRTGLSVSNNYRMHYLYPIFIKQVQDFFIGKDARELDALIEGVYSYKSNYKFQSYALWVPVATAEFAILDLLGKIAGKPMGALIGEVQNEKISMYQAHNNRGTSAEESVENIQKLMSETDAKALKFKVGGRMDTPESPVGRSEKLIPLMRKTFGDDVVIYADANGSYTTAEAIRIGKILQENNIDFFEEPVPFDWYEETQAVHDALKIPIAGGEQESSMHSFRWLIGNNALDILQPDIFYFGGMIRSMKVAKMANVMGKKCIPHISVSGLGYLYMAHFVSALNNAGAYHEFKGLNDELPFTCATSDLEIKNGQIKVPNGPGLSIEIDPDYIAKHKKINI